MSIPCALLACAFLTSQNYPLTLEAKTETVGRVTESTYTLSRAFSYRSPEIWRIREPEAYVAHWAPSRDLVWVAAVKYSSRSGDPAPDVLWVRDSTGQLLGTWRLDYILNKEELNLSSVRLRTFDQSPAEELILRTKSGKELRSLVVPAKEGEPTHSLTWLGDAGSPDTPTEAALERGEMPVDITPVVGGAQWLRFWQSKYTDTYWIATKPNELTGALTETLIPGRPTCLGPLNTGHFLLASEASNDTHKLIFVNLKTGHIDHQLELSRSQALGVKDIRVFSYNGDWIALEEMYRRHADFGPSSSASIEFWDVEGYRHQIDIFCPPGQFEVKAHVTEQPVAQRSEEAKFGRLDFKDEKYLFDANREYMARTRTFGPKPAETVTTMLRRRGQGWQELWTMPLVEYQSAQILENGTLVLVGSNQSGPVIGIFPIDQRVHVHELVGPERYSSKEEAAKFFSPSTLQIDAREEPLTHLSRIRDKRGMVYTFRFPLPNNEFGEFYHYSNSWDSSITWWTTSKPPQKPEEKPNGNLR